jgi:diguanylate cyclase (GGDEF)-like protein
MQENKLFEALLDVIPFAAYAVDIETYEVVYANKMMTEKMYAPKEQFCWKKIFGQEEVCSWCTIARLKQRDKIYRSEKLISNFFDESTDSWLQSYDELVKWPDGRTVKYSIAVDITEQKEIHASLIQSHTKLAIQTKKLKEANEKLEFLANKDYLTGIRNRGSFFTDAKKLFSKQNQNDTSSLYVTMIDIDNFKKLNDTYGHQAGDKALQLLTREVEKELEAADIFGRLGGEEFALCTFSCCEKTIIKKIEKIRQNIQDITFEHENEKINFTASLGLVKKEDNEPIDVTLNRVDKELYKAKNDGKNNLKFRL